MMANPEDERFISYDGAISEHVSGEMAHEVDVQQTSY